MTEDERSIYPPFKCPECQAVSWNPNDAREGYCGKCHWWTGDPILSKARKAH